MLTTHKRSLTMAADEGNKRHRGPVAFDEPRLCDMPNALELISDPLNAERAKERGILRNYNASDKYREVCAHPVHVLACIAEIKTPLAVVFIPAKPSLFEPSDPHT